MTKPRTPTEEELQREMLRYSTGERPWRFKPADWHIADEHGTLYPLKYTFGLAIDENNLPNTTRME